MPRATRRLRRDLPFRRIALVLSGGGGLGAYEVGVFRTLEHAGLVPQVLLGVSVGAINALIWVAHGFRSDSLRRVWRKLRPPSVGIRWGTLGARSLGAFLLTLAIFEALLTLADVPELRLGVWVSRAQDLALGWRDMLVDTLAWTVVALLGATLLVYSDRIEDAFARLTPPADPERIPRVLGWVLLALALLFPLSFLFSFPWPRRFHLVFVLFGGLVWLVSRNLRRGGVLRRLVIRTLPETGGRGLWRSAARRRLIDGMLPRQAEGMVFNSETHLILTACEVESGRMHYFVNWDAGEGGFRERVRSALGEVVVTRTREEILTAALASSAVPVVFEPVRIGGRQFVDGGVFSNQPIHAVLADGADALLLVLVSPSEMPPRLSGEPHIIDLAARLPQLANWRDLQTELRHLPPGWTREGHPARMCVIEPETGLPGSLLTIEPAITEELMRRGETDAWRALERAHWLEPEPAPSTSG